MRYGVIRRSSASPRPPCDGTPSAYVWPSPRQTPGSPCWEPQLIDFQELNEKRSYSEPAGGENVNTFEHVETGKNFMENKHWLNFRVVRNFDRCSHVRKSGLSNAKSRFSVFVRGMREFEIYGDELRGVSTAKKQYTAKKLN